MFGAFDGTELAFAAVVIALILAGLRLRGVRPRSARFAFVPRFAARTAWCLLLLAALPILLRLALLPHHPPPTPSAADDTSYLLLGDTLAHFRLANPPHPMHRFFETNFVLQEPTYSSIFPLGQGIALAIGQTIFGHPWAGVLLSEGLFCALCYWMLRAWIAPLWALAGGLIAVMEFGPLCYWMNSYWGGAISAIAGCLVFGALPRLKHSGRTRDAVLLGLGLGVEWLTRPYEFVFLGLSAGIFLVWHGRSLLRFLPYAALAAAPALLLSLAQNKAVTGRWTTLPYQLSRYQYGVPATFTFEPSPEPHRALTQEQRDDYRAQTAAHALQAGSSFLARLGFRLRYLRFFFFPPLLLGLLALPLCWRDPRVLWALGTMLLFLCGAAFYPYFYSHYIAAIACLFVWVSVTALERMSRIEMRGWAAGRYAAELIFGLTALHFAFWYGVHLRAKERTISALEPYESADYLNRGDPEGRLTIRERLASAGGKQLVFVRYGPSHPLREWIANGADIDRQRVVWALDLGSAGDAALLRYYPDRTAWLVEPDAQPPRITPYAANPANPFEDVH